MSSLVRGSLLIAAGTIYKILLSILIDKYLAVKLGVEDFGAYKYGITIVLLLSTLSSLGLGSSIVRFIAIQNNSERKKMLITTSLFLVGVTSVLILLLALSQVSFISIPTIFLYATIFFSFNTLFSSIYSGLEKPGLKVWINDIFGFTAYVIFLWTFFNFSSHNEHIAIVYLLYAIFVFIVNLFFSKNFITKINKKYISSSEFKEFILYSTPLFGVSLLIMLSTHLDKLILNFFVSERQLGIYYAVFNISNLIPLILIILVFMYLPRMSKTLQNGKLKKATILSSYFSKWTMIMASIFFGIIISYSDELLRLLYTQEFTEGAFVLKVLALGQWVNVSLGFTGQNLLALGDSKSQLYIRTFSFIIGSILLYVGSMYYGNFGAAISILIAMLFSNGLQIIILRIKHNFIGYRRQNFYALTLILFSGLLLSYVHKLSIIQNMNFIFSIFIDIIVFILLLIFTKVIGKRDLKALKLTEY
ncbi:oligosaccharide flippase family protein [uncultured Maribacter sp.]|uniref:oligosaccharide flippase family protein n=1 Tax=uncultured Maribacter sp. TaxID=431308 RepID=UPI0030EB3BC9